MINGKDFSYYVNNKECQVWKNGFLLGTVSIDETNAWTPTFSYGVSYLPINSCLKLLGYLDRELEIE